jgi:chromosome partitioning protein
MEHRLEKLLQKIRDNYDYVFIDCAPTDSVLTTMALTASDFILIPMRPDRFSILGFTNLTETVEIFRDNCPDPHTVQVLGVVFTQVTGTSSVETKSMAEITKVAKDEDIALLKSYLPFSPSFVRSVADQTPIFKTYKAKPHIRKAIAGVADEMKQQIATAASVKSSADGKSKNAKKAKKS